MELSEKQKRTEETLSQEIAETAQREAGIGLSNVGVKKGEQSSELSWDMYDRERKAAVHFWIRYDNATGDALERKWTIGEGSEAKVIRYEDIKLMASISQEAATNAEDVAFRTIKKEVN